MDQNPDTLWDLKNEIQRLRSQLETLESRLDQFAQEQKKGAESQKTHEFPPPLPPLPSGHSQGISAPTPEPALSHDSPGAAPVPLPTARGEEKPQHPSEPAAPAPFALPPPLPKASSAPKHKESFELQLGKHIIPVIGIIVLLTGLVFAGSFVYENIISHIGPLGKITALYLISAGLFGLGVFLERKYAAVKNYARLLIGGACAAAYYTTYAAHFVSHLRVIDSPVLGGILLLAAAGLIVWQAVRRQSQTLALIAILLGFYTSSINDIRLFTLFSNLILTSAAVGLILRFNWSKLPLMACIAAYGSYFYWRFFAEPFPWSGGVSVTPGDFLIGMAFLSSYWFLFLCAGLKKVATPTDGSQPSLVFLTFNNTAFFGLVFLSSLGGYRDSFWIFAISFGLVLVALSLLIRLRLPDHRGVEELFLAKGTGAFTLGLLIHLGGPSLSLSLVIESAVLLIYSSARGMKVSRALSYFLALIAVIYGIEKIRQAEYFFGTALSAVLIFNAWWASRSGGVELSQKDSSILNGLSLGGVYFSLLSALGVWLTLRSGLSPVWMTPALAVAATAFVLMSHFLKTRELSSGSHLLLITSLAGWMIHCLSASGSSLPWWNPLLLIAITLGLCRYWQISRPETGLKGASWQGLFAIYSLALVALITLGFGPRFIPEAWMALSGLIGVALLIYGLCTRLWPLAVVSQFFILLSIYLFLHLLSIGSSPFWLALIPLALVAGTALILQAWFSRENKISTPLTGAICLGYKAVAALMVIYWIYTYVPQTFLVPVFFSLSALCLALAQWKDRLGLFAYGLVLFLVGGIEYFLRTDRQVAAGFLPLITLLLVLGQFEFCKKWPIAQQKWGPLIKLVIVTAVFLLWQKWLHHMIAVNDWQSLTTVFWSAMAFSLFAVGMFFKERIYRLSGLAILAFSLGRVFFVDIWGWGDIFRILSLIALAIVLLSVGFIYNRYQDKIKEWL